MIIDHFFSQYPFILLSVTKQSGAIVEQERKG